MMIYFIPECLNRFRVEVFAYLMVLQKAFPASMDVTCQYFPYLVKVTDMLHHLDPFKEMKPRLSEMNHKAHNTKCEVMSFREFFSYW